MLLGVVVIVLGFLYLFKVTNSYFSELGHNIAKIAIAGGFIALGAGIFGILADKFKKFYLTIPFMTLAIAVGVLLLVATGFMGAKTEKIEWFID
jgi:hypothetical protein